MSSIEKKLLKVVVRFRSLISVFGFLFVILSLTLIYSSFALGFIDFLIGVNRTNGWLLSVRFLTFEGNFSAHIAFHF